MNLNLWRNTETVICWFKGIRNKNLYKFVIFDIKEFYPSITENLLNKALTFGKAHTVVSDDKKTIIHHVGNYLLYELSRLYEKKDII